jgi:hypothetical protein
VVTVAPKPAIKPAEPKSAHSAARTARIKVVVTTPKVVKAQIKPFRALRPQIRHDTAIPPSLMVTDEGAPFSPLPPITE